MKMLAVILWAVLSLLTRVNLAWSQHDVAASSASESSDSAGSEVPKKKRPVTLGFSAYAKGFRSICSAVEKDGRLEVFSKHIEYALAELDECAPCKAFLRSLGAACKIKPKKEAKKSETAEPEATPEESSEPAAVTPVPTVVPTPKYLPQREPSVELIDAVSQVFIRIALDEKRAPFAAQTVRGLVSMMRDPEELKPGEVEYLDILSEYLLAPFSKVEVSESAQPAEESEVQPTGESQKVDDLFE